MDTYRAYVLYEYTQGRTVSLDQPKEINALGPYRSRERALAVARRVAIAGGCDTWFLVSYDDGRAKTDPIIEFIAGEGVVSYEPQ